jgi:hypothetical protein
VPHGFGDAWKDTRVADWLDLLVPFVVLLPALGTLLEARVSRATYVWFAVGSWLYATGHGIHLAANSIGNAAPGETAHLWDEQVGHWTWYAGVAVVFATLASTLRERPPTRNPGALLLAVAVGLTWGTNAAGGHFVVPSLVLDAVALGWSYRHRDSRAWLVFFVAVGGVLGVGLSDLR